MLPGPCGEKRVREEALILIWGFSKDRPVRLRAYQAGLWGCLTNPGRVGGLVGSAYGFRAAYLFLLPKLEVLGILLPGTGLFPVGRSPYWPSTGHLFRPLARLTSTLERQVCHPLWPLFTPQRRLPPRVGGRTNRIPELLHPCVENYAASSLFLTKDTLPYRSVKAIGPREAFLLHIC